MYNLQISLYLSITCKLDRNPKTEVSGGLGTAMSGNIYLLQLANLNLPYIYHDAMLYVWNISPVKITPCIDFESIGEIDYCSVVLWDDMYCFI